MSSENIEFQKVDSECFPVNVLVRGNYRGLGETNEEAVRFAIRNIEGNIAELVTDRMILLDYIKNNEVKA